VKVSPFAGKPADACDTDHDRHGVVTRSAGLLPQLWSTRRLKPR